MLDDRRAVRLSKYLSKYLRHTPHELGLELEPGGWVKVADLLAASATRGFMLTADELVHVVIHNPKQRFALNESGTHIRANQGHSVPVDLQLVPAQPPQVLFHGTAVDKVARIFAEGLKPMRRHHVHLAPDRQTAYAVGARHGPPVLLEVAAAAMWQAGHVFYCSANGVWLVDSVAPCYLQRALT